MKIQKIHLVLGLVWLLIGMTLGQIMGESGDHGQLPTHAHIMLVGGVLSILWALLYRSFPLAIGVIAAIQTAAHHLGTLGMVSFLYLRYGGGDPAQIGPLIGLSGVLVMLSVLLMLWLSIRSKG